MSNTSSKQAHIIKATFDQIKSRGGHAAIDYKDGEIMLACTKPGPEQDTWGRGSLPQTYSDSWVRLVEC